MCHSQPVFLPGSNYAQVPWKVKEAGRHISCPGGGGAGAAFGSQPFFSSSFSGEKLGSGRRGCAGSSGLRQLEPTTERAKGRCSNHGQEIHRRGTQETGRPAERRQPSPSPSRQARGAMRRGGGRGPESRGEAESGARLGRPQPRPALRRQLLPSGLQRPRPLAAHAPYKAAPGGGRQCGLSAAPAWGLRGGCGARGAGRRRRPAAPARRLPGRKRGLPGAEPLPLPRRQLPPRRARGPLAAARHVHHGSQPNHGGGDRHRHPHRHRSPGRPDSGLLVLPAPPADQPVGGRGEHRGRRRNQGALPPGPVFCAGTLHGEEGQAEPQWPQGARLAGSHGYCEGHAGLCPPVCRTLGRSQPCMPEEDDPPCSWHEVCCRQWTGGRGGRHELLNLLLELPTEP